VIRLVEHGHSRIGNLRVQASEDVMRKNVTGRGIEAADWAALGGLRSSENVVRGAIGRGGDWFGSFAWHGWAAGTDVHELASWFERMGTPRASIDARWRHAALFTGPLAPFDVDFADWRQRINAAIDAGRYVVLAVHQDVMSPTATSVRRTAVGGHFVLLTSRIEPRQRGGVAGFDFTCLTWGRSQTGWFPADAGGQALQGYVAVDLGTRHDVMPDPPGPAPAAAAAPALAPAAPAPVAEVGEGEVVRAFEGGVA
jgi:hypothetical protein